MSQESVYWNAVAVNLDDPFYDKLFLAAPVYRRVQRVRAHPINWGAVLDGRLAYDDVRYDPELGHLIDVWETHDVEGPNGEAIRTPYLAKTQLVRPGQWLLTKYHENTYDRPTHFVMNHEDFERLYTKTKRPMMYECEELIRVVENDCGTRVWAMTPEGEQYGGVDCVFVAPYFPDDPEDLGLTQRRLMSRDELARYELYQPAE